MVKHCYKTFIVSLLCWSLLTLQSSVVFAAVTESPNNVSTDANGNISSSKTYTFDKLKDADMLASITMLAGGFITARMITSYRPITTDVMIAGAGGAAFLAGEVLSNIKFKGTIDEMAVTVEKHSEKTINEEQQQRLKDLKASYEEAKKATQTKKTLQLAAAAAFGAAALTATYMAYKEVAQVGICRTALQTAKTALSSCVSAGIAASATVVAANEGKACGLCTSKILPYEFAFNKYNISRIPPGDSNTKDKANNGDQVFLNNPINYCSDSTGTIAQGVSNSIKAACGTTVASLKADETSTTSPVPSQGSLVPSELIKSLLKLPVVTSVKPNFFEKVLNAFFPTAEAGWLPLLGFAASTAAAFYMITGETATKIDMLMFIPKNRAIAFGLLAGLSYAASKSSDNVVSKLDENIKKIDAILGDIEKLGNGIKAKNVNQLIGTVKSTSTPVVLPSSSTNAVTPCLGSNASSNCTPISSLVSSSSGFSSLPESLQSLATDAVKLGEGVSGTSTLGAGTLSAAESLGNKQAAIGRALSKAQDDLSKLSSDKGTSATPSEQQNNLLNSIGAKINKGLQQKGLTASGFMGSVGGTAIDSTITNNKLIDKESIYVKGGNAPLAIDLGAVNKGEDLKLSFKEQNLNILPGGGGTASSAPEYEINANEIAKENGPSIFEVISSRYIKSGYPKLLEVEPTKK
jgi:phosphoribosylcarboxyaminoimidazole (NCAIR) mutase